MSDPTRHPSFDALDAVRTGDGSAADVAHVRHCAECRRSVADLADLADVLRLPLPAVPESIDERVRWAARHAARRGRREVAPVRRWAIAASVLVAIGGGWLAFGPRPAGPAGDVDGNGRIDVRDAFAIARALDAGATLAPHWDANGDHHVDRADVDAVMRRAVQVHG